MSVALEERVLVDSGQKTNVDETLVPFQCLNAQTLNGTPMVLSIVNLSNQNMAEFSAVAANTKFDYHAEIPPFGQRTFAPFDFEGQPLAVCNLTSPNKPANIRVILKGIKR